MPDIGLELQQARLEKKITLEELSGRTHIAKKYLKALEDGDYKIFPGEVYVRGALRRYAEEVGLSTTEVINWYEAARVGWEPEKASETKETLYLEIPSEDNLKDKKTATGRLIIILLCIILAAVAGRFAFSLLPERVNIPAVPPPPPVEEPVDSEPGDVDTDPQDVVEPPAVTVERDSDPNAVRFNVYGAESLLVSLSFSERCWVRVTADGIQVADENFRAGMEYSASARREVILNVGYPEGMRLKINEQPVEIPLSKNPYSIRIILNN
jgi:transcriptional regulator with XRE-family HTH domain